MPSPSEPSLCIYGDSHLASLKLALDQGLVETGDLKIEFWGADGPLFREIDLIDGRARPRTEAAMERVKLVNGNGRTELAPDDFSAFLFAGGRLRNHEFTAPMLCRMNDETGFLSQAVRQKALHRWLNGRRSYRIARTFAASGRCTVFFAPAPFLNETAASEAEIAGHVDPRTTPEQRAAIWDEIEAAMAADGVRLIRQPEETVTKGALTKAEYATERARERRDAVHMNGAYGALVLRQVIDDLLSPG